MNSSSQEPKAPPARILTVNELAKAKALPAAFLRQVGLSDLDNGRGVGILYRDRAGDRVALKRRTALAAKEGSWWPSGTSLMAYGDWKLHEVAKAGWLVLVEGESDCWTLWHHGFPAIGLPGSCSAKTLTAEHLVGVTRLFVHIEPDNGGKTFHEMILRRLSELRYTDETFTFHMPAGFKDPSALHIDDPETFAGRFNLALQSAEPQTPSHLHVQIQNTSPQREQGNPAEETREPYVVRLTDVAEEKVHWLWPGRIPLGKLTILDGDPGLGKSTLTLDLAARLTTGKAMPATLHATLPASNVVLLTEEDGLGDTIRPRLAAAEADPARVTALKGIKLSSGTLLPIYLPNHVHELHDIVAAEQAKLVVIDPLMAYLPESVNSSNDQSVRHALLPLSQFAEATGAAVVVVRHLNKQPGKNAIYRGGGSIGIIGAARSGLLVCKDLENPSRRYLGVTKSNLCKQPKTLAFELIEGTSSAIVQWHDEIDGAIEDMLAADGGEEEEDGNEADAFLAARLSDGPVPAAQVQEEGAAILLSKNTLKRAKKRLKIKSRLIPEPDGKGGHWMWELPPAA